MNTNAAKGIEAGSSFLVRLTQTEIKKGFFVAGHRFEQFRTDPSFPRHPDVLDSAGTTCATRKAGMAFNAASSYFSLFGQPETTERIRSEDKANVKSLDARLSSLDSIVRILVYDCADLFGRAGLEAGDYLRATMLDGNGSKYRIEPLPATSLDSALAASWESAMERAFREAMEAGRPSFDPFVLIRDALQRLEPAILREPGGSLDEFIDSARVVSFVPMGTARILWKTDCSIQELDRLITRGMEAAIPNARRVPGSVAPGGSQPLLDFFPTEENASFDAMALSFLEEPLLPFNFPFPDSLSQPEPDDDFYHVASALSLSVDSRDLKAFLLDALVSGLSGKDAIENTMDRILHGRVIRVMESQDFAALRTTGSEACEKLLVSIDIATLLKAREVNEIRTDLLSLYGGLLLWMRCYDPPVASNRKDMRMFEQVMYLMNPLLMLIYFLNEEANIHAEDIPEYRSAADRIRDLVLPRLHELILPPKKKGGAKAKKSGSPSSREVMEARGYKAPVAIYELDIVIEETNPPIRRLLSVPGNRTLADLHAIIQKAFGWTNSHLHLFIIRKLEYGEPSSEDYNPVIDEATVSLDGLKIRKGSFFSYIYDFGDNWQHLIRMSGRVKLPEEEAWDCVPYCLEGTLSVPPEDCGGPPGYEDLLASLATPKAERTTEQKEFLKWVGPWKPDHFSITQVNQALAKL